MKRLVLILFLAFALSVFSCKKDDVVTCTTCSSPDTSNFEVCQEKDGNASVNGQNTGTPYGVYIQGLEETGASCGD